jgi:hypothetical protein
MRISVLGPIPRDRIITHNKEVLEKYGGVIYTTMALSSLVGREGEVIPIAHIGSRDAQKIDNLLLPFENVDRRHIAVDGLRGDVVTLTYFDQNERSERQTGFMSPILPQDVAGVLDSDVFICLPISDYEVPWVTLAYLRANSSGAVILDAHGPTNAVTRSGERVHKFWFDRDLWLPHVDVLKMNLQEAGCSWFKSEYSAEDLAASPTIALEELPRFAAHCLSLGVKALCVTLDQRGCVVYFHGRGNQIEERFVERVPVDHVVDTTGCGDSFAAGFAFGLLRTGDYVRACQYGNAAGAQRCLQPDFGAYWSLEETERQITKVYGVA